MTFQIYKDNKIVFQTNEESCIPSDEQLKDMHRMGYRYKTLKSNTDKSKPVKTNESEE